MADGKRAYRKRTPGQREALAERKEAYARANMAARARKERTHRLVASAAEIEAESGIEIDAYIAAALGRILRQQAGNPSSALARYIKERGKK